MPAKKSVEEKAYDDFIAKTDKSYGVGVFQTAGEPTTYDVIPTGSIVLDYRLGVGGWVIGRMHELWGSDGIGKSTLAMETCREAQKKFPNKRVCYIDVEQRLDKKWARDHGIDTLRMTLVQPKIAEDVSDIVKDSIRSGLFSVIVLDSIGAMISQKEIDKDANEATVGKIAGIVTRMVKTAAGLLPTTDTTMLIINQVRANIAYGGSDTTTGGGFALKHCTTTKIKMRRGGATPFKMTINGEADRIVGHQVACYVERNGVAPAYRTAMFNLFHVPTSKYGPVGLDRADEAATVGIATKVIEQSGAWYTVLCTGERVNGRPALVELLREQPNTIETVREQALATISGEVFDEEIEPSEIQLVESDDDDPVMNVVE